MYMCMPTWACEYVATCTFYCIIVACLSNTADEGRPEMAGITKYYFNESILEFNPELQVNIEQIQFIHNLFKFLFKLIDEKRNNWRNEKIWKAVIKKVIYIII